MNKGLVAIVAVSLAVGCAGTRLFEYKRVGGMHEYKYRIGKTDYSVVVKDEDRNRAEKLAIQRSQDLMVKGYDDKGNVVLFKNKDFEAFDTNPRDFIISNDEEVNLRKRALKIYK